MSGTEIATAEPLPLESFHRRLGAVVAERRGALVAARYGAVADEVEALRRRCGLVDRSWIDRLEIRGEDRERFLSGMVTCAVRDLGDGGGAFGMFTDRKGGVLSDLVLLSLEDRFLLELPPGRGEAIETHLEPYLLVERVDVAAAEDPVPLTVAGEEARRLLRGLLGGSLPESAENRWGHAAVEVAGVPVRLARRPLLGTEAWTVWVPGEEGRLEAVARALLDAGAEPVGYDALETVRVEAGIPTWGIDYDRSNLPQETGLDEALNFTKGCYLGQEVVARIHYRGSVNRRLVGLEFDADEPPASGSALSFEGRPVGRVGSVAVSPELEGPIGLAVVHRRGAEPGTRLEVEGGGEAEVAELPFVGTS